MMSNVVEINVGSQCLKDAQAVFDNAHAKHLAAIALYHGSPTSWNAAELSRARFARSDAFDELADVRRRHSLTPVNGGRWVPVTEIVRVA